MADVMAQDTPANAAPRRQSAFLKHASGVQRKYDVKGMSCLVLVCSDMARTVKFCTEVLRFPLTRTVSMPGVGQQFFFEYAPGQSIAYFCFESAPPRIVNVTTPNFGFFDREGRLVPTIAGVSAHGTMHHVAFEAAGSELDRIRADFVARGVPYSEKSHGPSRSLYFQDPDGIILEFTENYPHLEAPEDRVIHEPATIRGWPEYASGVTHTPGDSSHYNLKPQFQVSKDVDPDPYSPTAVERAVPSGGGRSPLLEAAAHVKPKYQIRNLAHLALVCADMEKTTRFYADVLKFPLAKTLSLKDVGQHFFFEYAPNEFIAYFWFENAPKRIPNVTTPNFGYRDSQGVFVPQIAGVSSHGTMHHVAFQVEPAELLRIRQDLIAQGFPVVEPSQDSRSIYVADPDGIVLEFAAPEDPTGASAGANVRHEPATAADLVPCVYGLSRKPRSDHHYNVLPSFNLAG